MVGLAGCFADGRGRRAVTKKAELLVLQNEPSGSFSPSPPFNITCRCSCQKHDHTFLCSFLSTLDDHSLLELDDHSLL